MLNAVRLEEDLDRWVRRLLVAGLLLLAATLLGVGIALYAPPVQAATRTHVENSSLASTFHEEAQP
jgi:hypothetical protein